MHARLHLGRREDGGGDEVPVHGLAGAPEEPPRQHLARLDRHRRQLHLALQHVPHCEHVRHVGPLVRRAQLAVGLRLHAGRREVEAAGVRVAAGGVEDGVEDLPAAVSRARTGGAESD